MGVWVTIKMMVREKQIMNRSIKCVTYKALISPLFFSDPYYFREGMCGRSLPKHRSNSVHEQKYVLSYYRKKNLGQNIKCCLPFAKSIYIWFLSAWALQDFITVFKSCVSIRKYAGTNDLINFPRNLFLSLWENRRAKTVHSPPPKSHLKIGTFPLSPLTYLMISCLIVGSLVLVDVISKIILY